MARSLFKEIKEDGKDSTKTLGKFGSGKKSKKHKGGAAPAKTSPNKPKENPLKKNSTTHKDLILLINKDLTWPNHTKLK